MKIVKKITTLIIASTIALSSVSCGNDMLNTQESIKIDSESTQQEETIEIYKTMSERGVKVSSVNDCKKLYLELENKRIEYDDKMQHAYSNYQLYTSDSISQLVLNTTKIYYDMMCLISPIYDFINQLPEDTDEQIVVKINNFLDLNKTYEQLDKNCKASQSVWFYNQTHINKEIKKQILLYSDLYELAEISVGGHMGETFIEKNITRLNKKLTDTINEELNI